MASSSRSPQETKASTSYISASANRHSRVADVSSSNFIAFGSGRLIALWSPDDEEDLGILETLPGHDGLVTCVRFQRTDDESDVLYSGDDKGTLKCWKRQIHSWVCSCTVSAHSSPISALAIYDRLIITGASDSSVSIWKHSSDSNESLKQTYKIDLRGKFPLDIQASFLPESRRLILAIASTDRNVSLWVQSGDAFNKAASLSGHEDWVKCLAFQPDVAGNNTLTLASGSHDGTIRLWNIERLVKKAAPPLAAANNLVLDDELLDSFEASLGEIAEGEEGGKQISLKRHIITVSSDTENVQYSVTFDALLVGHEAGVTSLSWRPSLHDVSTVPVLLSTSTDSSLILWSQSSVKSSAKGETTTLWINQQRFGDIGGQRLGGFVGGLWTLDGDNVLAWGWAGGWRRWKCLSQTPSIESQTWEERSAITGHRGSVQGLNWTKGGEYVITTGPDQTTRIHACVRRVKNEGEVWREIGRPQVHGYDLVDAVFLSETKFVSIADEKVARVFEAPKRFLGLCKQFDILNAEINKDDLPTAASVPPLGLSNKALSQDEVATLVNDSAPLDRPPFEGELAMTTLWPEVEKIFGHGYELYALAASHSGRYIATACKSTTADHAGIRVCDTDTWQLHGSVLQGHSLTVTRITFSPDDQYILTVSRDRNWILHRFHDGQYEPFRADKSHTRIIWDCAWAMENDLFATASRDKTVKLWNLADVVTNEKKQTPVLIIKTKEAATSVAFAPSNGSRRWLAIGQETGEVLIYLNEVDTPHIWTQVMSLGESLSHVAQVNRLSWRPAPLSAKRRQLASCSDDGTMRITTIQDGNITLNE
ncbi:WD40 repeat-like protein [Schizopora paradoxa]|uniref:Elongator complex protein 2 n=1 Tax=Schizopora paradoxa TaxID=27342 RepID=A0A0H2S3N2_9AGAM|nr:WD40 repeat-like protein [Schizopora paradoxa]